MKTVFLALCEPGKKWIADRPLQEQPEWATHASFMDALFESGHLLFGGPMPDAPGKVMLVIAAPTRPEVFTLMCQDPWVAHDIQRVSSVHEWDWTMATSGAKPRKARPVRAASG